MGGATQTVKNLCPVNWLSCFYGLAFVLALAISLFAVLSLAGINRLQFYDAEENECWAQNASAFYGEDNILYCPNTFIVSEVQISDSALNSFLMAYVVDEKPPKAEKTFPPEEYHFNTGDSGGQIDWYFLANEGSQLQIAMWDLDSDITLSINHKNKQKIPKGQDTNVTLTFESFNGYEVKLKSKGATSTKVVLKYTQVYYGDFLSKPDDAKQSCSRGLGCNFELDFGKGQCVNMWYDRPRNWGVDYLGQCVMVDTKGYDYIWAGLILPSCAILVCVLLATLVVVMTFHRTLLKERDAAVVMRNVDSDSNLRAGLLDHDQDNVAIGDAATPNGW
eukprot:TRINITY_DN1098_c0_g1_i1.p1 TRINITY_DN1098_c0_g1~~TRINITY_DN1098_c0_g1_i1.p1  ORF type:complete len:392 (-),score=102.16 TRINITY_DN1098_c0_g1_i1:46-1047(-)